MANVKIGVVGVGGMGRMHADAIQEGKVPGAQLAAVCDADPDQLKPFPGIPAWTDAKKMFAEAGLDAVLIATPHYAHVPLGIVALNAGLHVLMEKPIAVHKADAERLIAAHRDPSHVFAVMFNQRTDPRYQWVRTSIQNGTLGRINRVCWTITTWFRTEAYYRDGGWRATWAGEGGGVLLNQAPHQLDLWQWMFGMPDRVRAFCGLGRYHDIEVEDDVTALLDYSNGMSGIFITTTGETPGTNRLEIAADHGRVIVESDGITFDRNNVSAAAFSATADKPSARPGVQTSRVEFDDTGTQHAGILKNFVETILGRAELIADAREGIRSLELGNAILLSGLTDATVELPLDGDVYEKKLQALIRRSRHSEKRQPEG